MKTGNQGGLYGIFAPIFVAAKNLRTMVEVVGPRRVYVGRREAVFGGNLVGLPSRSCHITMSCTVMGCPAMRGFAPATPGVISMCSSSVFVDMMILAVVVIPSLERNVLRQFLRETGWSVHDSAGTAGPAGYWLV